MLLQTETQRNVASCWVVNTAEVTRINLEHKQVLGCCTASVKRESLPPFRVVRASLLFSLATKQNLEWPTFIPTQIPPPLASSNMHSAANALELNGNWKCEVDHPITRHTTPCWYELPFQTSGGGLYAQTHTKKDDITSHEAVCLENKQAVWDESVQRPSGRSLPFRLSTTSSIQITIQLRTVQQK